MQNALLGALRREDAAVKQAQHVQLELAATQDLLAGNQRELQRNMMVMKFRNAEVERLRVCDTAATWESATQMAMCMHIMTTHN